MVFGGGTLLFVVLVFPALIFPYEITSQLHGYNLEPLILLTRILFAFAVPLGLARLWASAARPPARSPFEYSTCYFASFMLSLWVLSHSFINHVQDDSERNSLCALTLILFGMYCGPCMYVFMMVYP